MLHLLRRLQVDSVGSDTGTEGIRVDVIRTMGTENSSCYKRKRDGTPSRVLKATSTLIREGVCSEIKKMSTPATLLDVLLVYAREMQGVKNRFFVKKNDETDFVDKFYKLQVQNDILQTTDAREASGHLDTPGYSKWVRDVITRLRSVFRVSTATRLAQQERTRQIRTKGLEEPITITEDDCNRVITILKTISMDPTIPRDKSLASSLCLLQLATGGRARDVIFVNIVTPEEHGWVRISNITKKKIEDSDVEIVKPLLKSAFESTDEFMTVWCRIRTAILSIAPKEVLSYIQWNKCGEYTYPSLDYQKQWDKSNQVESFIGAWSAKMRRILRSVSYRSRSKSVEDLLGRGKGTHQLRKLYVACSHRQSGTHMKEPAWAQRVLGHANYETSLLYTNMIYENNV